MDRRVTPPKRVTSPTWDPTPLCKQALSFIQDASFFLHKQALARLGKPGDVNSNISPLPLQNSSSSQPRFPFSYENSLTWGVKCKKSDFRKAQGIYQISFENCTGMERSSRNFQLSSSNKNCRQYLLFRKICYRKQSLGAAGS